MPVQRLSELREAVSAKAGPSNGKRPERSSGKDVWTAEAERIASNIRSLGVFLKAIRRAYLDLSSSLHSASSKTGTYMRSPELTRPGAQNAPKTFDLSPEGLAAWERVRYLSDRERDEIDFQAKGILRRCVDRIRELERVDKPSHKTPGLVRMLGIQDPVALAAESRATQLTAHRAAVTLYLNNLLADVGKAQQAQQELRVKRQLERTSGGAASAGLGALVGPGGAVGMTEFGEHLAGTRSEDRKAGRKAGHDRVPSIYTPNPQLAAAEDDDEDIEGPIDSILTPQQVQVFEAEASSLLRATQDQLASLRTAESSLLEISALQNELVVHLTSQAAITDQLWDDAITVTGRVEQGNKQLKQAAERNREGRIYLLVFLIGASLSLLFLDYYA